MHVSVNVAGVIFVWLNVHATWIARKPLIKDLRIVDQFGSRKARFATTDLINDVGR